MITRQSARAAPLQGIAYGLIVGGTLFGLLQVFALPFEIPYQVLTLVAVLLAYLMFRRFDLITPWHLFAPGSQGGRVMVQWLWLVGLLMFVGLATETSGLYSRTLLITWFVVTPVSLWLAHLLARQAFLQVLPKSALRRSAVIIFANESARMLAGKLEHSPNFELHGYFEDREEDRTGGGIPNLPFLGKARSAAQYVRDHDIQVVFVVLPDSGAGRALHVLDEFGDTTASLYYVPDFFVFSLLKAQLAEVEGVPVLQVAETPFYGVDGLLKRLFDLAFASVALLLLTPVLLGIALAVKFTSPGPVLFKQKRYGLNGKRFWVYKFRSMVTNAEADRKQASRGDSRITPVGRFIRKTSLDELPQFWNVVIGEMSVVGPRPHPVALNEHSRKEVKRYMVRHKVKPGVTGWAQVNGFRGETANIELMEGRIRHDLEYIRNWSPALDLRIIGMTVWMMMRGDKNAF